MKISDAWKTTAEGKKVKVYLIRYQDKSKLNATGKPVHRQETFEKKKHADARLLVLQNEMADGFHIARTDVRTVAQAAEEYLRHAEDKARDGRIGRAHHKFIREAVDRVVVSFLGSMPLSDLSVADVEAIYRKLVRDKRMAPDSAIKRIGVLKMVTEFAVKRKWMRSSPVAEALAELRGVKTPEVEIFKAEDVKHLLRVATVKPFKSRARSHLMMNIFVHTAAFCGLRWGEIAGLTLGSIDPVRSLIVVRNSLSMYDGLKEPKTASGRREVPVPQHLMEMLREWTVRYQVENVDNLLFTGYDDNKRIYPGNFQCNLWQPLLKRAGLDGKGYHFHSLRHFAASWWIANGLPLTDVAKLMGHSKVSMTLAVYAHAMAESSVTQSAIERMSRALVPVELKDAELALPPAFAPQLRGLPQVIENAV